MANTHAIMKSSLAKALIDAGVQHFDLGGPVATGNGTAVQGPVGGTLGQILGNNSYQAGQANIQAGTNAGQLNDAYNKAQTGISSQQGLASSLQPQTTSAISNQQTLAQQLLNQSNGSGPNPAQSALNSSTGTNVANQAALMAGQRGAGSNPALIAKLAAEQGANTQQQAVGQSATLQAEQQLAAQKQLGELSGQQVGQAESANNAANAAAQGEQGILQNANNANNNANVGIQSNINNVDAATSAANAGQGAKIGSLINGAMGNVSSLSSLLGGGGGGGGTYAGMASALPELSAPAGLLGAAALYKGGKVDASNGAKIAGKSKYPGNDPRNDVVPAILSKGEEVLPNSVTQSKDAPKKAAEFVKHLQDKKGKGEDGGYSKVVSAKKSLKERVEALEKLTSKGA